MEKKGNRSIVVSSPKGVALSESNKKNQDGVGAKLWPRSGRRREPTTNGSGFTKNEPLRRPIQSTAQQRYNNSNINNNKFNDRKALRPSRKNTMPDDVVVGRETTRLDDEHDDAYVDAHVGSVFIPGSKKQSLNHLLNFTYEPYVPENNRNQLYHHSARNYHQQKFLSKKHKYNKEHFLQANCQFIVNESGDYKQYLNNPDALVDWDLIEQVNVHVTEYPSCPICLYPPVAAKITKCGHIYCWSCILHYLALSDHTWRKCPICYDAVQKKDLRSVVNIPHNLYNVNDFITFKLMKRRKGSLIAYPADEINIPSDDNNKENIILNLSDFGNNTNIYSKLLLANSNEILSIIEREFAELSAQKIEAENCPEICFIDEALTELNHRKNHVNEQQHQQQQKTCTTKIHCDIDDIDTKSTTSSNEQTSSPDAVDDETFNIGLEHLEISPNSSKTDKFHYFYQASDGQHIYLHSINAKMVEHTFGSLEFGPPSIRGKILEKEVNFMDEELRKRLRYLQHLPLTCQFEVAEIQLDEASVNKETIEYFHDQLETRRKRRQRRAKEEKKRERRIATEENRLLGKPNPALNLHIDSESQFPCFSQSQSYPPVQSIDDSSNSSTPAGSWSNEQDPNCPGLSFAKIIGSGSTKKKPIGLTSVNKKNEDPVKLINVTGAKIKCSFSNIHRGHSDSESESADTFEPIPHNSSLADAIEQALQKKGETEINDSCQQSKKKKKKNKQKLLFSNTMSFGK